MTHHRRSTDHPLKLERKREPVASRAEFIWRLLGFGAIATAVVVAALGVGVCGYHYFCDLAWIDSLLNASMILGGMGPVNPITTTAGKLFSAFYALFSGLIFVISFSVIISPVVHRVLHKFHVDEDDLH